jgi:DNA primase
MAGLIPENILEDILSRINIVEVISGFIPLKRAGRNFKALCPFHHEKTPSFMVSPDRQIYHVSGVLSQEMPLNSLCAMNA